MSMRAKPGGDFAVQLLKELVKQKAKGRALELPEAAMTPAFQASLVADAKRAAREKVASAAAAAQRAAATAEKAKMAEKVAVALAHAQVSEGERPSFERLDQLNQKAKLMTAEELQTALAHAEVRACCVVASVGRSACLALCPSEQVEKATERDIAAKKRIAGTPHHSPIAKLFQAAQDAKRRRLRGSPKWPSQRPRSNGGRMRRRGSSARVTRQSLTRCLHESPSSSC